MGAHMRDNCVLTAHVLRSWVEVECLAKEWNDLLEQSSASSIFLSWEWLQAWRAAIDDAVAPFVVVVRENRGRLVGVAPLYEASFAIFRVVNCRALRFMADVATGSEYPDWIADKQFENEVAAEIARELERTRSEWDLIWLQSVSGWTNAEKRILEAARKAGLMVKHRPCEFSAVDLPSDVQAFEERFPGRRRQQIRRAYRQVAKLDGVEFVRCDSLDELPEFLDALFELHQLRWHAVGQDGCFRRKPAEERFYREFAPVAYRRGWLAIYGVRENGILRAVQFGYVYGGRFLQLQEGFDPEFKKGAGNALRYFVFCRCIDAGLDVYDFLGGATEHKRRWGAKTRGGYDILIGDRSLKSRLAFTMGLWPTGRFVEQRGIIRQ